MTIDECILDCIHYTSTDLCKYEGINWSKSQIEQIAEWLEELKAYKENQHRSLRHMYEKGYNKGYADGSLSVTSEIRNKAIDDFVCYMCNEFDSKYAAIEEHTGEYVIKRVHSIAEELKHEEYNEAISDVVDYIERYKEKYNNGWIPCSERLPRDYEEVLADVRGIGFDSSKDAEMIGHFFQNGKWFYSHGMQYLVINGEKTKVIAWQPLPEPFKER